LAPRVLRGPLRYSLPAGAAQLGLRPQTVLALFPPQAPLLGAAQGGIGACRIQLSTPPGNYLRESRYSMSDITGAARLHHAVPVLMDGLGSIYFHAMFITPGIDGTNSIRCALSFSISGAGFMRLKRRWTVESSATGNTFHSVVLPSVFPQPSQSMNGLRDNMTTQPKSSGITPSTATPRSLRFSANH